MFGGRRYPLRTALITVAKALLIIGAVSALVYVFVLPRATPSLATQRRWTEAMGAGMRKRLGLGEYAEKTKAGAAIAGRDWGSTLGLGVLSVAGIIMAVACYDVNRMMARNEDRRRR